MGLEVCATPRGSAASDPEQQQNVEEEEEGQQHLVPEEDPLQRCNSAAFPNRNRLKYAVFCAQQGERLASCVRTVLLKRWIPKYEWRRPMRIGGRREPVS